MTGTTVLLVLNAGRADYVDRKTMPFLSELEETALTGRFESPPGFAERTVLFTGRYPDTSGDFSAYEFDPEGSPFGWTEHLGPLVRISRPRRMMWPARWSIKQLTSLFTDARQADPAWIPPPLLPYFRPSENRDPVDAPWALGAPSLFDVCREHGLSYRSIEGPDDEIHDTLVRELRDGATSDLYVAEFDATDEGGHRHGPHSPAMRNDILPEVDAKVSSIHDALRSGSEDWNLLVCGDHGMAPVERRVDVLDHLGDADATHGKDYAVFVNSTLAVVWYFNPRGRREVDPLLADVPGSRVLDDDERSELRIPQDPRWGDRMIAARPGVHFWPDYFHEPSTTVRGTHGYVDTKTEGQGMGLLASSRAPWPTHDAGVRSLVDVFPTVCDLLDVPTPGTNQGESLLPDEPDTPVDDKAITNRWYTSRLRTRKEPP